MDIVAFVFAITAFGLTSGLMSKNKKLNERVKTLEEKMGLVKSNNNEK